MRKIIFPVIALFAVTLLAMPSNAVAHCNGVSHKLKSVEASPVVIPQPPQTTSKQTKT